MVKRTVLGLSLAAALAACTNEPYKSGDTDLSYLRTDFVVAKTDGNSRITTAITDDGDSLLLSPPKTAEWATAPDSAYRALLYGNRRSGNTEVEAVGIAQVPVLVPQASVPDSLSLNDPLGMESAWVSKNKKYINLALILKTGKASDAKASRQRIGLACDSIVQHGSSYTYYIRLLHGQNGVPEYYSTKVYASIPLSEFHANSRVELSIPTYEGMTTRTFSVK
ncbi:NigD1/NigD2 family lipoprotein [Prevotella dentasini]|uniref:NigD1/NigD2 family lipoprotein n=1 Tax=Prevotella dentasini TaxID=589537 RepID=UPI000468EF23|nr:NigD-like C-terminal domain-containing protein [Prevotella dentasini]